MDFFTVFISDSGVVGGAGVCSEDDAIFVDEAYDCGTGFGGEGGDVVGFIGVVRGGFLELCFDEGIAVNILEVESSSGGGGV